MTSGFEILGKAMENIWGESTENNPPTVEPGHLRVIMKFENNHHHPFSETLNESIAFENGRDFPRAFEKMMRKCEEKSEATITNLSNYTDWLDRNEQPTVHITTSLQHQAKNSDTWTDLIKQYRKRYAGYAG